ncbi:MAG: hypothetical protein JNK78_19240 [Planctomycetes bacterium]|nr:hypothetical protein [Planctomycetota bacterium]
MFRTTLRTVVLSSLSLVAACAFARQDTNEPLDATTVAALQAGVTTARDVTERLGAPTEVVQLGRRTAYRYDATSAKSTVLFLLLVNFGNQDTRSDRLWVFFDEKDVLSHYGVSFGTHRTQYAMPWEDVHEASDNASRDADRPGVVR